MKKQAVFLDRDGTINRDVPYCSHPDEFNLLPGVGLAIARLNQAGFIVIVVTNQSGIARGYFTEKILSLIHAKMKEDLAYNNAWVDAIYYCPHHPDDCCNCRKPKPGMLIQAAKELKLDLKRSYLIGDSISDLQAGKSAECKVVWLEGRKNIKQNLKVDFTCKTLNEGISWIVKQQPGISRTGLR